MKTTIVIIKLGFAMVTGTPHTAAPSATVISPDRNGGYSVRYNVAPHSVKGRTPWAHEALTHGGPATLVKHL